MVNKWLLFVAFFISLFFGSWFSKPALAGYIEEKIFGIGPMQIRLFVCTDPKAIFDAGNPIDTVPGDQPQESLGLYCLGGIVYRALNGSVILLLIGLFVMLMIGGIRYATAGGDEKSMQTARKTITYAVIGLATAVVSVFILIVAVDNVLKPGEIRDAAGNITKVYDPLRFLIPDFYCTAYGQGANGTWQLCQKK